MVFSSRERNTATASGRVSTKMNTLGNGVTTILMDLASMSGPTETSTKVSGRHV
jgi:hypothetical protein